MLFQLFEIFVYLSSLLTESLTSRREAAARNLARDTVPVNASMNLRVLLIATFYRPRGLVLVFIKRSSSWDDIPNFRYGRIYFSFLFFFFKGNFSSSISYQSFSSTRVFLTKIPLHNFNLNYRKRASNLALRYTFARDKRGERKEQKEKCIYMFFAPLFFSATFCMCRTDRRIRTINEGPNERERTDETMRKNDTHLERWDRRLRTFYRHAFCALDSRVHLCR